MPHLPRERNYFHPLGRLYLDAEAETMKGNLEKMQKNQQAMRYQFISTELDLAR